MDDWLKPGSTEAVDAGCTCPVLDNGHGRGYLGDGEQFGWAISGSCPVHRDGIIQDTSCRCDRCKWIETDTCYACFLKDCWEEAKRGEEV